MPITLTLLNRDEGSQLIGRKSGTARDVECQKDRAGGQRRIIDDDGQISCPGASIEVLAFVASRTFVRLQRHQRDCGVTLAFQQGAQEWDKIRARSAQPNQENWLRAIRNAGHAQTAECQDIEVCQVKAPERRGYGDLFFQQSIRQRQA